MIDALGRLRDVEVRASGEILLLLEHSTGSQIVEMTPVASEASDDAG